MNKAKRILELEPEQEKLAGTYSYSKYWKIQNEINALAFELAREVERDYVRKDRLVQWVHENECHGLESDEYAVNIGDHVETEDLLKAINSGELDGDAIPLPVCDAIILAGRDGISVTTKDEVITTCHAARDGECIHALCPQLRDGEPERSGRHCPLDNREDE